jgi:hypothetical protein
MYQTNLDYFLLDFGFQGINPQTVLSLAHAPQTLVSLSSSWFSYLLAKYWFTGIAVYSSLKSALSDFDLQVLYRKLKPLMHKDYVSTLYLKSRPSRTGLQTLVFGDN